MRVDTGLGQTTVEPAETGRPASSGPPPTPWDLVRRTPYLAGLPTATRERVRELADRVAPGLCAWAQAQPGVRPERIRPLALTLAAATPFSGLEALASTAQLNLWIFALDDVFDERGLSVPELRRQGDRYAAIARGAACRDGDDDLATILAGVRADLARYPLFEALGDTWADAVAAMIRDMTREAGWQRDRHAGASGRLPSYEQYLAGGRSSVGAPTHIWTALITIGDPSTPAHLPALRRLIDPAAMVVRLANDLRSAAKEAGEGKVNSLIILAAEARARGLPPAEALSWAKTRIRADIAEQLGRLSELERLPGTATGGPEASIVNIARFVSEFYDQFDFHTFDRRSAVAGARAARLAAEPEGDS